MKDNKKGKEKEKKKRYNEQRLFSYISICFESISY